MAEVGLQIDDDPEYQRRVWRWQRRAWGGIAAVIAFAAVGGFGDGPLSSAEAGDAARGLVVTYERFGRAEAPSEVEIAARPGPDRRVHLRLGAGFLEDFNVEGLEAYRDAMNARMTSLAPSKIGKILMSRRTFSSGLSFM